VLAGATHACAAPGAQPVAADECRARIVVGFAVPTEAEAIAALAAARGVQLVIVARLLPDLYVLDLAATGVDTACASALERVRSDPTVRSVELDSRRGPNSG
jgi:hypothetical protein